MEPTCNFYVDCGWVLRPSQRSTRPKPFPRGMSFERFLSTFLFLLKPGLTMKKESKSIWNTGIYTIFAMPIGFILWIFAHAAETFRARNRRATAENRNRKMEYFRNISK